MSKNLYQPASSPHRTTQLPTGADLDRFASEHSEAFTLGSALFREQYRILVDHLETQKGSKSTEFGFLTIIELFKRITREHGASVMVAPHRWVIGGHWLPPDWEAKQSGDDEAISGILVLACLMMVEEPSASLDVPEIAWKKDLSRWTPGESLSTLFNARKKAREAIYADLEPLWQEWLVWAWGNRNRIVKSDPQGKANGDKELNDARSTMPNDQGYVEFPADSNAYVPANEIINKYSNNNSLSSKNLKSILGNYKSCRVKWTRPRGKNGLPISNRLSVHLADWMNYLEQTRSSSGVDEDGFPKLSTSDIEGQKAFIRQTKLAGK